MAKSAPDTTLQQYTSLAGILIVLVGIGYGANWVYHQFYPNAPTLSVFADPNEYINAVNESVSAQTIPKGLASELDQSRLYFMLANKGSAYTRPYVFENGFFAAAPLSVTATDDTAYYSYSPDSSTVVFTRIPSDPANAWDVTPYSEADVFVAASASLGEQAFATFSEAEALGSGSVLYAHAPSVSNEGEVIFSGWRQTKIPNVEPVNDWTIFYTAGDEASVVTNGYSPKWLDDTSFVFLKNDGLYHYSLDTEEESLLFAAPSGTVIQRNNKLDVSNDGTVLVWTRPSRGEVHVFDIISNEDGHSVNERGTLRTHAFWPVISPSGNYLALQSVNWEKLDTRNPEPRVLFYDLSTLSHIEDFSIGLDAFEQEHMFMTEWSLK